MSSRDSDPAVAVLGTGEFQRRELHATATVEMRGEIITKVSFSAAGGAPPPAGAAELESLLTGRDVYEALWLLAADREAEYPVPGDGREVLIEAFHRAVEVCLDQQ